MNKVEIFAIESIKQQAEAILNYLNDFDAFEFQKAIQEISQIKGKVVVTGVGKSGLIGKKISATLSSTGTPSLFMHPTEAIHGDLGVLSKEDIVIALGKSGESNELNTILQYIKKRNIKIISITSNPSSTLARLSDVNIFYYIDKEACPNNLAPTTSTTLTLVIGDAIAIALMKFKNFGQNDFAQYHPGGLLGRRLLLKVKDLLIEKNRIKVLDSDTSKIENVLEILTSDGLGIVIFVKADKVQGIITDGDIRRLLGIYKESFLSLSVSKIINTNFVHVNLEMKAYDLLLFMENREKPLNVVIVLDNQNRFAGIIRIHELYKLLK